MERDLTGLAWSATKKAPREGGASSTALRPVEREPEEVVVNLTTLGGGFQSSAGPRGIWLEERSLDPDGAPIEGWVDVVSVVDGVADSGWQPCKGGQVCLVVHVVDSLKQREWVRAMAHGGAYAEEVLG